MQLFGQQMTLSKLASKKVCYDILLKFNQSKHQFLNKVSLLKQVMLYHRSATFVVGS
jgi:hypothetical protein